MSVRQSVNPSVIRVSPVQSAPRIRPLRRSKRERKRLTRPRLPLLPPVFSDHHINHPRAHDPPRFLLPSFTSSPSPARLFHSSVSRRTPSRYAFASGLPSTSSSAQWPERRRCRLRFSQRQSGLKVQPGWGQRYGLSVCDASERALDIFSRDSRKERAYIYTPDGSSRACSNYCCPRS